MNNSQNGSKIDPWVKKPFYNKWVNYGSILMDGSIIDPYRLILLLNKIEIK